MKKSRELIEPIVSAATEEQAVEVLKTIVGVLNFSPEFIEISTLRDKLNLYKDKFKSLEDKYVALGVDKEFKQIHSIRTNCNFLYRATVDDLTFDVNNSKIYYEEAKSSARAAAMLEMKGDSDFQSKIKVSSTSSLRDVMGHSNLYKEYVNNASISYAVWQELNGFLNSLRMFTDSLASESRNIMQIDRNDVK